MNAYVKSKLQKNSFYIYFGTNDIFNTSKSKEFHCVKSVPIRSYLVRIFPHSD